MAFRDDENAKKAEAALIADGFNENDITRYINDDVIQEFERSNEQAVNPVQIGQDVAKVAEYLALAKEGCGFLVVHAAEEERSKRAVAIVKPYGLKFAEKYNRLTLEELA